MFIILSLAFHVLVIDVCYPFPCDGNAACTNVFDDFTCACNPEFIGDGYTCLRKLRMF